MMIFAGETWKIVSSEAAAAGMSPEAMVSRAIAEFVDRRRRAKEIPAQSTARVTHKVEKLR
jgi:hypothetical protein